MNVGMAVQAGAAHGELRIRAGLRMADRVALVAKPRRRHFQHALVDRAMRIVTVRAVLAHRRVLEQERSALLGMALVAIVVDRVRPQQLIGKRAMRIMAIRANYFTFA